jgi:phage terminase large subunit-like protein
LTRQKLQRLLNGSKRTAPIQRESSRVNRWPKWIKDDVIRPAFGWKKADGRRKYTIIYVEIPRGNAKSTLGTALGLYMFMKDGEKTPEVYCAAGSKDQAGKVFEPAKIMVLQSPDLKEEIQIFTNSLYDPVTFGSMKVISADGGQQHGHNASCVIFDELHVQKKPDLYEALTTGLIKREQPMIFIFTTAGVLGSFAEEIHNYAVGVKNGTIQDERFLPVIYSADLEADDFDPAQWEKANPGWDYINHDEFIASANMAKESAVLRASFRRYNLNKWSGAEVTWMPDDVWMKGTDGKEVLLENLLGRKCFVGLDLSSNRDTTAAVFIFPPENEGEKWLIYPRIYIPERTLYERADHETVQYLNWADEGHIIMTPGSTQDYEFIRNDITQIGKKVLIQCVGFDSWNANETVQLLEKEGVPMLAYQQSFRWMNAPMQLLESLVRSNLIEHGGHPVLRWHNQGLQAENKNDFIRPVKKNSKNRVDGMVALIVAFGTYLFKLKEQEEQEKSIVKTQGVLKIQLRR